MPALPSTIEALIFGKKRQIAGIIPDVVIEEKHTDQLVITDHPVERGAVMSDHAYMQPAEVTVKFGWSDSSRALNGLLDGSLFGGLGSLSEVYDKLRALQASCEPFELTTGKRHYGDMLIKTLAVETNAATESALMVTAAFRHVRRVSTSTLTLELDVQAEPSLTAPTASGGARQLLPREVVF